MLGTFLAALKTVMTNLIQTGSGGQNKLHPLDLLMRMSPLAFIQCVALSWSSGELERVREYGAIQMSQAKLVALLINGILAFGLNVVSMTANKKTSALTMSRFLMQTHTVPEWQLTLRLRVFCSCRGQRQAGPDYSFRRRHIRSYDHSQSYKDGRAFLFSLGR